MGIFAEPPAKIYVIEKSKTYFDDFFAKIISAETSAKIIFPQKPMNSGFRVVQPVFLLFLYIILLKRIYIYKKSRETPVELPRKKDRRQGERGDKKEKQKPRTLWHISGPQNRPHPPRGVRFSPKKSRVRRRGKGRDVKKSWLPEGSGGFLRGFDGI